MLKVGLELDVTELIPERHTGVLWEITDESVNPALRDACLFGAICLFFILRFPCSRVKHFAYVLFYMLGEDIQVFKKARSNDGILTVTERNLSFANGSEQKRIACRVLLLSIVHL